MLQTYTNLSDTQPNRLCCLSRQSSVNASNNYASRKHPHSSVLMRSSIHQGGDIVQTLTTVNWFREPLCFGVPSSTMTRRCTQPRTSSVRSRPLCCSRVAAFYLRSDFTVASGNIIVPNSNSPQGLRYV
eukprot:7725664-Pyramimonas_sp.AAC.1